LVSEPNFGRLFSLYEKDEMNPTCRLAIIESFLVIAKNIGLRKLFLKRSYLNPLMKSCLKLIEIAKDVQNSNSDYKANPLYLQISLTSIRLLCTVCTVRTNRFYIPGETSIAERLRKRSFDTGTFTLMTHLYSELTTILDLAQPTIVSNNNVLTLNP
jgi:hypothetical protein